MSDHPIGSAASNEIVRRNLAGQGDGGSVPRAVSHFGRPGPDTPAPLDEVIEDFSLSLSTFGFAIEVEEGEGEDWVVLTHVTALTPDVLDGWTQWLVDSMADLGWIYDGWECDVLRPEGGDTTEHEEMTT